MKLTYSLQKEDYVKYLFYTFWESPSRKVYRKRFYIKLAAYFVIINYLVYLANGEWYALQVFTFALLFSLLAIFFPFLIYLQCRTKAKKFFSDPANAAFTTETGLTLDQAGVSIQNVNFETKLSWSGIVYYSENKTDLYLFLNTQSAVIIPHRLLSENDRAQLISLLNNNSKKG